MRASNEFKAQIEQEISQLESRRSSRFCPPGPAPAYTPQPHLDEYSCGESSPGDAGASNDEPRQPPAMAL